MNDSLKKILKSMKGSLLTVAIQNEYILDVINKNKDLTLVYTLNKTKLFTKKEKRNKQNDIKIRKLKRKFKDKLDYMVCDVNGINIDLNRVIYNTYNIIGKKIIYYGIYDSYDVDIISFKYERFGCKCKKTMYDKEFILEIDTKNIKVSKLFIYKIIDLFKDIVEGIGNLLIS